MGRARRAELEAYAELRRRILAQATDGVGSAFEELAGWVPEATPAAVLEAYRENGGDPESDPLPFFTEVFLYELLGKEDARALLARVRQIGVALGHPGGGLP